MSSYLKRYSLFRARNAAPPSAAAVADDSAAARQVIEINEDADGFADVRVRPMTYAEVARGDAPLQAAVVTEQSPFAVVDEAQWAVNEVQRYISECETQAPPRASTHVTTNQDYLDRAEVVDKQYLHSKRGRRSSKRKVRARH